MNVTLHLNNDLQTASIINIDGEEIARVHFPVWSTAWTTREEVFAEEENLRAWQRAWDFVYQK